jgi:hypothetical protein
MSAGLTSARDMTMRQPTGGQGMDCRISYMCVHKGLRTGGHFRVFGPGRQVAMRCAACQQARGVK